ncbi:hypothetical protein MLD38_012383 [Melastoma candidum]|uniref:Uncharacterized protein n=1 Tax=Melastoma candidum TaxID=119954 RepID=A0ACB9R666_9MYRT|nr:hypothetical protein MLD38_012383 [Melastoma candidum]
MENLSQPAIVEGLRRLIRLASQGRDCGSQRFPDNRELDSCRKLRNNSLFALNTSKASRNSLVRRSFSSVTRRFASINFWLTKAIFFSCFCSGGSLTSFGLSDC